MVRVILVAQPPSIPAGSQPAAFLLIDSSAPGEPGGIGPAELTGAYFKMVSKILHLNIMDSQMQLRVGRSAGAGRGQRGTNWVAEMIPDELWRERQGASEGSESGPPGHGTWSHQGGFSPQINETLRHWIVMASLLRCVAAPGLRTRVQINGLQGAGALGARSPAWLCCVSRTQQMHGANATPAQQEKNHSWKHHEAQEGRDGPAGSSGLGYKGNGSAEPVLCLTALFIPRYPKERGPFPQMSAKHRAC